MLQKLMLAFGLGVLLTGGVVYVAMKNRTPEPAPVPVSVAAPVPTPPVAEPEPPPAPEPAPPQPEPAKPKHVAKAAPVHRAKPKPVVVAKNDPPTAPAPEPPRPVPVTAPPAVVNPDPMPAERPAAVRTPEAPAPKPEPRKPHSVTVPAGTMLTVRLREELSSKYSQDGQNFTATLDQPLVVDGFVIAERGSSQRGRVVGLDQAGRVKGRASLSVELTQLNTADGQRVDIKTDTFHKEAESGVKGDMAKTGIAAGIGAAIGAIAGGGKGAAIGAGIGGAAGAGGVLATRGKDARLPSETRITFRLKEPLVLTEKLDD